MQNLKSLALAFHHYHETYGSFPPAYVTDENGRFMHSWRVLVLQFVDEECRELHDKYDFEEPWNSPGNSALSSQMPKVFRCPSDTEAKHGDTSYVMIVGAETISHGKNCTEIPDIKDGSSYTILLVETTRSGINWLDPRDLKAEEMTFRINDETATGIRSNHPGGAYSAFCDGAVHFIKKANVPENIRALSRIAGREPVDMTHLE